MRHLTPIFTSIATKLQRTFTMQIEALAKLRGKGEQVVRVEHVTVHPGAQAIVGDVHHHAGGGASHVNQEDQRYGTGASAAVPALPGQDPLGNGVPIPRNAKRAMSHTRRTVTRRTEGKS